jgi:hypothetical protein
MLLLMKYAITKDIVTTFTAPCYIPSYWFPPNSPEFVTNYILYGGLSKDIRRSCVPFGTCCFVLVVIPVYYQG